jgi:hypothetical protein
MPDNTSPSTLLEVFVVDDDLSDGFVEYDTRILNGGKYKLPKGQKLVLLLQNMDGVLWTTIRRYTSCKLRYYRDIRGADVNIKIEKKNRSLKEFANQNI